MTAFRYFIEITVFYCPFRAYLPGKKNNLELNTLQVQLPKMYNLSKIILNPFLHEYSRQSV